MVVPVEEGVLMFIKSMLKSIEITNWNVHIITPMKSKSIYDGNTKNNP
jgi:hypothetical protein